ncbi:MAG: MarR family transcriptional regulator [Planctomycetota bacterium]
MSLYNALRIVVGSGDQGIRISDIAERMIFREPDCTRLVHKLENAGLVERRPSTADKRAVIITATTAGKKKAQEILPEILELHRHQLKGLTQVEMDSLNNLLVAARCGDDVSQSDEEND